MSEKMFVMYDYTIKDSVGRPVAIEKVRINVLYTLATELDDGEDAQDMASIYSVSILNDRNRWSPAPQELSMEIQTWAAKNPDKFAGMVRDERENMQQSVARLTAERLASQEGGIETETATRDATQAETASLGI